MTPAQLKEIEYFQDLHKGWSDDNTPIAVLHARWLLERIRELETAKDEAYQERNQCVALIARMVREAGGLACKTQTPIEGWSEDWHGCVYIQLPTGQVSWHYHTSHAKLFEDLPDVDEKWDGHDTAEKYRRVNAAFAAEAKGNDQ